MSRGGWVACGLLAVGEGVTTRFLATLSKFNNKSSSPSNSKGGLLEAFQFLPESGAAIVNLNKFIITDAKM